MDRPYERMRRLFLEHTMGAHPPSSFGPSIPPYTWPPIKSLHYDTSTNFLLGQIDAQLGPCSSSTTCCGRQGVGGCIWLAWKLSRLNWEVTGRHFWSRETKRNWHFADIESCLFAHLLCREHTNSTFIFALNIHNTWQL